MTMIGAFNLTLSGIFMAWLVAAAVVFPFRPRLTYMVGLLGLAMIVLAALAGAPTGW